MIINGASRSGGAWFAKHLTNADHNERVTLTEITGLPSADDIAAAFRVMEAIADCSGRGMVKNYFYHASINPEPDERLPPEQRMGAIDTLESNLGLTGQPRIVVEHEKKGRVHWHVIWSRIDIDTGKAISDSLTASIHEQTSRQLEAAFGLKAGKSVLVKGGNHRHDKDQPKSWERFRGMESGIDPRDLAARITALWQIADSGKSFAAAIEGEGFILAKGDKPGVFLVIDPAGQEHSLVRRLKGVTTREMQARLADIDREALPDAATARALQRVRMRLESGQGTEPETMPAQPGIRAAIRAVERPVSDRAPKPIREPKTAPAPRGHGGSMPFHYAGRPVARPRGFRFPTWKPPAPKRVVKDRSLIPTPVTPDRAPEEPGLASMAGTGPKHRAINTLGPTPVEIPEDPDARAAFFAALSGTPQPEDLKAARDRAKAGREEEARLKAAGRSGRVQPGRWVRSRRLSNFRKAARKLTGREIDTRLLTEAERTQLAAAVEAKRIAQAKQLPQASAARPNARRRDYEPLRKLTGRDIDTRQMTEAERTELARATHAADRQAEHQNEARDRETERQEKSRIRARRWFKP